MHRSNRTVLTGGPALLAALIGATLVWPRSAEAADFPVYEVTVPLAGPTTEERAAAFAQGLHRVAVRATGRSDAASSRAVTSADAGRYVQRYSTTPEKTLKVRFDREAVEGLLERAGLPVWPVERPLTRVVAPGLDPAAVESAADQRGLPVAWAPSAAGAESTEAVAVLSGSGTGDGIAWTFTHAGERSTATGGVAVGIDLAADTLAGRYAPPSTRSVNPVVLRVHGVNGVADYAGLLSYLRSLSLVHDVAVESISGDTVRLRTAIRGDASVLARVAALDSRLRPQPQEAGDATGGVDFLYGP